MFIWILGHLSEKIVEVPHLLGHLEGPLTVFEDSVPRIYLAKNPFFKHGSQPGYPRSCCFKELWFLTNCRCSALW